MRKASLYLTVVLGLCLVFVFGLEKKPFDKIDAKPSLVPDEIIVQFEQSLTPARKDEIRAAYNLQMVKESYKQGEFVVYRHANPLAVLPGLNDEPGVVYAEHNAYAYACMEPNDPLYNYQWNMARIGMQTAWDYNSGTYVFVAVLDTGVLQSLQDLGQTYFLPGWDFVNDDSDPSDDHSHGSHVCGTIAQSTNNHIGVAGIAYTCAVMPVKVLDQNGVGSHADIASGIYYAVANGAHVINMSFAGAAPSATLENAVNYAWDNGVLIVCAAGAGISSDPYYPAAYPNAIAVNATDYLDHIVNPLVCGSHIDIAAPGGSDHDFNGDGKPEGILQNTFGPNGEDGFYYHFGTSPAAAHVSGAAALVKNCNPQLSNAEIRAILEGTAADRGDPGPDPCYGSGLLKASAAVQYACGDPPCMLVYDITMEAFKKDDVYWATARICIIQLPGAPLGNAKVSVTWDGVVGGSQTGNTDYYCKVYFKSPQSKLPGPFIIKVEDVFHPYKVYCPELNVETTDSITYGE